MTIGSLFSGIGGLELGLEAAGLGPVVWQVEQDVVRPRCWARPPGVATMTPSRLYQLATVVRVHQGLRRLRSEGRRTSVVVQCPTGGGKSRMMADLQCDGVIAPGVDLVRQLQGTTGAQVYTCQDLAARLRRGESLPRHRRWGLDEARWVAAPGWGQIVDVLLADGAELVLFDATPATPQGQGLGRWAEELYQAATMRELIARGYLVPFRVLAPAEPQRELAARPVDAWRSATPGESAIVFAQDKRHAAQVTREFLDAGVMAVTVTDDTRPDVRGAAIGALAAGNLTVAVCAQILRQGIDVPRVSSIILARAVESLPLYLQAVGRGGRPFPGKDLCTVLDLRGCSGGSAGTGHGLPEDDREWSLEGQAVRPASDPLPPCVQCRACLSWGRGGACGVCGASLPPPPLPRVKAADLIEVRRLEGDDRKRATLDRYVRDAVSKGHNPWSAAHRWRGVYGEEAPRAWMIAAIRAAQEARAAQVERAPAQVEIFR